MHQWARAEPRTALEEKPPSLSQEWNLRLTQGAKRQKERQVTALEFPQSPALLSHSC